MEKIVSQSVTKTINLAKFDSSRLMNICANYLEDLATLTTPVRFATMEPRYTKLGPLVVQPTKTFNLAAVDLCFKKRPQSLFASII